MQKTVQSGIGLRIENAVAVGLMLERIADQWRVINRANRMEGKEKVLLDFLEAAEPDPRIATAHISLFISLWKKWKELESGQYLVFFSFEIMPACKISSSSTFHKVIKQLDEYGYIKYLPSFNHFRGSRVEFNFV